jgi:hypothetical protein
VVASTEHQGEILERHWYQTTRRLRKATVLGIGMCDSYHGPRRASFRSGLPGKSPAAESAHVIIHVTLCVVIETFERLKELVGSGANLGARGVVGR